MALGRYWSHDASKRIVCDPDDGHVWLITRYGTFREFSDAGLDGDYESVAPSDEYRSLTKTIAGWELRFLEGTVQHFDDTGLWTQTVDPNGNASVASYAGTVLDSIAFPDGRSETFGYHPNGKLATITEVGVDTVTTRTWSYTWLGDDLVRIDRPDGTAWTFLYTDVRYPGYLTRMTLEGTDASDRIVRAWAYDDFANAVASWAGATIDTSPQAVDVWRLAYDNPLFPSETQVTDPLGNVSTYTFERDPVSRKVRVTELNGDCPTCGVGPNVRIDYDDAFNPLRPTERVDGRGTVARMGWTTFGMLASRIEDFGGAFERETTWDYDPTFPSLVTEIEQPSTSGNALDRRRTTFGYSASGDQETRTIEGVEDGAAFVYSTVTTYTAEGVPDVVDPPGYGSVDQTSLTYDPARGSVIVETRTDPLIGTTTFGYDPFNRCVSVIDPNGVLAETTYDDLDRVRFLIQRGAVPVDDLVTEHRYNVFGDLFQTVLPEGNVIEYNYDQAGRLVTVERTPDDQPTSHGERTVYTLNGFGHRIRTEQQRWDGMAWVLDAATEQTYSTRCHLDRTISGAGTANESITEYAYDCDGNLERLWDPNHPSAGQTALATMVYAYDALDRLATVTQPFGSTMTNSATTYGYDVQDHLTSVIDAEGTITSYIYSDRDLLTSETSEVSGTTTQAYNEHGELVTRLDARGVLETRIVDELDRVTVVDYPNDARDIAYTYDDAMVPFSLGRLTSISRDGAVFPDRVDYGYDRFGRVTQDGALIFNYDKNGNRTSIGYPGGTTAAATTFDFADREESVTVQQSGQSDVMAASNATYLASGPLRTLDLGNGVSESRSHDARYHPDRITAAGGATLLDWDYTTDAVGNIATIADLLTAANDRTYGYLDHQYFLTQGDGPWGTRAWTYDPVGNRLTEDRDGVAMDVYSYVPNAATGNSPRLTQIDQTAIGVITSFAYDPVGNQTQVTEGVEVTSFAYDDASRLSRIERLSADEASDLIYDGRSFLRRAEASSLGVLFEDGFESGGTACWDATVPGPATGTCSPKVITGPTYSSDGVLHHVARREGTEQRVVLYLAGRPVAILSVDVVGPPTYIYLTADHLGTPVLATDSVGVALWDGGFEPFGADYDDASGVGMFLRFPGQWVDEAWGVEETYNVHRTYFGGRGTYGRPDPLSASIPVSSRNAVPLATTQYQYALQQPMLLIDKLGLAPEGAGCCKKAAGLGLFADANNVVAGGTVICCGGTKTACVNPTTAPEDSVTGRILTECIIAHETSHFDDVRCRPNCETYRPRFRPLRRVKTGECRASKAEVQCLRMRLSGCSGDPKCVRRVNDRIEQVTQFANSFGKCRGI